ncbi:MAG: HAMP domain-containing histidine kinase [Oscillospiraceae bacterium]|nr:HAMP domain-containing histidine kinase [Oscillospiraceae bacterium]
MAIISANDTPVYRRYSNTQIRYAVVYLVITTVVLLFLNFFCSKTSQDLFYESKKNSMIEKCLLAADEISKLEVLNSTTVTNTVEQLGSLKVTRLIVTDQNGLILYDSSGTDTGRYALLSEIVQAMDGKGYDVFTCHYQYSNGSIQSHAATPVVSYGTRLGCVYMMEYDTSQGRLIKSLQDNVLRITVVLEVVLILFSLFFSNTFSRRLRQIMASMRIIQQGDYTHKVRLGGHDELTFLGDEFNDLTEKLQTSEQKRRRFVSDASHELKTPLASIKLLADSILQNDMDMETVREFVGDIGDEAERLNRMTAKLLSLTKVDGRVDEDCEIIDVAPTVERVVRMLSTIAAQNDITMEVRLEDHCPILILEDDLYQIAFNLIENGIKYNMPGGRLTVTLRRQEENAVLMISDTGVGIPEDALDHIFERFYRVDKARSRATGGSGLGLAIVRAIVQRNKGEIFVESTVGQGTTFIVSFPLFDTEEDEA